MFSLTPVTSDSESVVRTYISSRDVHFGTDPLRFVHRESILPVLDIMIELVLKFTHLQLSTNSTGKITEISQKQGIN